MGEIKKHAVASASRSVLAGRGAQTALVIGSIVAVTYARFLLNPLQELVRVSLSLSDNQIAILQGPALTVLMVIVAVPLGLVIDRRSRVGLLFIFLIFSLSGSLLTAAAPSFSFLFAVRCIVGLTACAISPIAFSLVADLYPPSQRGRAIMMMGMGQTAGMSAAFGFGGAFLAASGTDPENWRWAMLWLSAPLVISVLMTLAMREPARIGSVVRNPTARAAFLELWRYRSVMFTLLMGIILIEIALGASLTWAGPALLRTFALAPERISAIMAIVLLVSGLTGPVVGGTLADFAQRTGGPRQAIFAMSGLAVVSGCCGLFAAIPSVSVASAMLLLFLTTGYATAVMGSTLITIVLPNQLRGLGLGIFLACVLIFFGLAPLAVSLLSSSIGGPAMIGRALALVCTLSGFLAAGTFAFGNRYFHRTVNGAPCSGG
jgi:predicted MFS family arabinose efflux permease